MEYDRVQVKLAAKAALRGGDPKPWLVTLVYYLLAVFVGNALVFAASLPRSVFVLSAGHGGHRGSYGGFFSFTVLFVNVLVVLLVTVLDVGYHYYSMNLWRGRRTEVKDLFYGFHMAGKAIALSLLIALFTFLWSLACLPVFLPLALLSRFFYHSELLFVLFTLLSYLGFFALLMNRTLRYSLAFYVLLDHPDRSARDCLNESKLLMTGRCRSLFVLLLSFSGWFLLAALIYCTVIAAGGVGLYLLFAAGGTAAHARLSMFLLSLFVGPVLLILLFLLAQLCSLPLFLWLTPYLSAAKAAFYDCAAGTPPVVPPSSPEPPVRPFAPSEPTPHSGSYYSGFIQKDPVEPPDPREIDSDP